jgi:hypothetical protein
VVCRAVVALVAQLRLRGIVMNLTAGNVAGAPLHPHAPSAARRHPLDTHRGMTIDQGVWEGTKGGQTFGNLRTIGTCVVLAIRLLIGSGAETVNRTVVEALTAMIEGFASPHLFLTAESRTMTTAAALQR